MSDGLFAFAFGALLGIAGSCGVATMKIEHAKIETCREMGGEWVGEVNAEGIKVWSCKAVPR